MYSGKHFSLFACLIVFCVFSGLSCAVVKKSETMTYRRFHVVEKDGMVISMSPIPDNQPPLWAKDVSRQGWKWVQPSNPQKPYFKKPVPYVIAPPGDCGEPFYSHNHCPSITWLNNGDLLAVWFSTVKESDTEMTILAGRLRAGAEKWDTASEFFKAENRNMTGSSLFHNADGTICHFNGMGGYGAAGWTNLALLLRTSADNGVTWTLPRAIGQKLTSRHQVISGTFTSKEGLLIQPCDAGPDGNGGTALYISKDNGKTWFDSGLGKPASNFQQGATGYGTIAGIHAGVVELKDGRLMALGRGDSINGRMPMSLSDDTGKRWTYSASPFPPIGGGQRLILKRLREGPIMLISFTNSQRQDTQTAWTFTDAQGNEFYGVGMYAALSFDEGQTWPVRKLLTPGEGEYDGGAWTGTFTATPTRAEHAGYLAAAQTPDGIIHLISSRLYYKFNLAWLETPPAPNK